MNNINKEIKKLVIKAFKKNEIAVAAIIVKNNQIISKAYNMRMARKDVTAHAEILAIKKAEKKIGDWRLNGCEMYVTLKPCKMCEEVIKESRLDKCWYFVEKPIKEKNEKINNICYKQTSDYLFFKNMLQNSLKNLR